MKVLSLVLISIFFSGILFSQDFAYNGPAMSEVKSFWINAIGIQKTGKFAEGVATLEAKLKMVKQKDPAYKTDKMEAEITKWKNKAGSAATTEQPKEDFTNLSPTRKSLKADELLRKLFDEVNIDVSRSTLPVIEFRFKEYSDKVEQYISLNTKPKESDARRIKTIIEKHVYATNQDITNIENSKAANITPEDATVNFYLAKYNQLYWDAAVKLFPEEASFADEYKLITELVNKNGSLESMKAGMNKNNEEGIKSRKLPPAVMKDANAEKMIIDAFNKVYASGYKGTATKAITLQSEWHPVKNELTSVIIGRQRQFAIVYKGGDGKCYLVNSIYLYQEYNGGGYANSTARYAASPGSEMLCENVK